MKDSRRYWPSSHSMDVASAHVDSGKLPADNPKVNYMGPENGPFLCGECRYFYANDHPCEKVSDPVKTHGCCNLFQPEED